MLKLKNLWDSISTKCDIAEKQHQVSAFFKKILARLDAENSFQKLLRHVSDSAHFSDLKEAVS